jgi:uncharacterized membrane protein (UPF0127 family)
MRTAGRLAPHIIGLLLLLSSSLQAASPARLLADFPQTTSILINDDGPCVLYDVWVASSPAQRSQGLMFIEELGVYEGMIFLYRQPANIAMWMKNTLIPLDMLFILGNQRIINIAENTTPLSTDTIYSSEPVQIVLELSGGSAERWNFNAGDGILFNENPANLNQPLAP